MKIYIHKLLLFILFSHNSYGQIGTWMAGDRHHPELTWRTVSTKNFNIHYHDGLEKTARKSAKIAENVIPILMEQMNLDSVPKIDITLTREDEFENAFAVRSTYQTFIWVEQNDMTLWLEKDKWLETVIAHELQHVLFFEKTKTWIPSPMDVFTQNIPAWAVEGIAEYMTESWRPYRAELEHKRHVIVNPNKRNIWDPHADGFSKLLYWSDRFGDSTIVKVLEYRNEAGLYNFEEAFKKINGISVKRFVEDWRILMNTYYYGYRSQKETYQEMGKVFTLPIKKVQSFSFHSDSSQIALLGLYDDNRMDTSLIIAERDTSKEAKRYNTWLKDIEKIKKKEKKTKKDSSRLKKKYKEKILWKKTEVDFGRFHPSISWSPSGDKVAYSKYHYAKENQSLVYDIKVYDKVSKTDKWVTSSMRARYPVWINNSKLAFVSVNKDTSNIFISNGNETIQQLTNFKENTQIMYLSVSPDFNSLAFSMSPSNGNIDIYSLDLETRKLKRVTENIAADTRPVWHSDGTAISFTSHRNGVPNVYTANLSNGKVTNNTDSGDGIITKQWMPKEDALLLQSAINTTDSIRLVKIDPFRKPRSLEFSISNHFKSWKNAGPDVSFVHSTPSDTISISKPQDYKFWKTMRRGQVLLLPPSFGLATWVDAMSKNIFAFSYFLNDQNLNNSGFLFQYMTFNFGPTVMVTASRNSYMFGGLSFRLYDENNIFQYQNGVSLALEFPKNFSKSLSSNHIFALSASLYDHVVGSKFLNNGDVYLKPNNNFKNLPYPESGKEGLFSLYYIWKSIRPHKWNMSVPLQGFGINIKYDYGDSSFFGDFSYSRIKMDSFANIPISMGPIKSAVYLRAKSIKQSGSPPSQYYVGLTNDQPIYLNGLGDMSSMIPENHNPRGWKGFAIGDQLIYGTAEYRLPVIPQTLSFNLISDYANVWNKGSQIKEVWTYGYEFRISLGPVSISAGDAQTNNDWKNKENPERYYRLTLVNPF